jgi:glutaredoxin
VAREFLVSRGAQLDVRDVRTNPEFVRELLEDLKSQATPTVVIGKRVIIGFDPQAYDIALGSIPGGPP